MTGLAPSRIHLAGDPVEVAPALSRAHLAGEWLLNGCDSHEWTSSAQSLVGNAANHIKYHAVKPHLQFPILLLLKSLKMKHYQCESACGSQREKKATIPFSLKSGSSESLEAPKAPRKNLNFLHLSLHNTDLIFYKMPCAKSPELLCCSRLKWWRMGNKASSVFMRQCVHLNKEFLSCLGYIGLDLLWIFPVVPPSISN